jgi:hypothetical protein
VTIGDQGDDDCPEHGQTVPNPCGIFLLASLLLIVITTAGLAFGREAAQAAIIGQFSGLMGKGSGYASASMLQSAGSQSQQSGTIATIIGIVTLLSMHEAHRGTLRKRNRRELRARLRWWGAKPRAAAVDAGWRSTGFRVANALVSFRGGFRRNAWPRADSHPPKLSQ